MLGTRFGLLRELCVALIATALNCATGLADIVVLYDGRQFEGKVLENTKSRVVIDAIIVGIRQRLEFSPWDVKEVTVTEGGYEFPAEDNPEEDESSAMPRILVVPLHGTVGDEITAGFLARMLRHASKTDVAAVVLDIDTAGGSVDEVHRLLGVISSGRERHRLIAFIQNQALSAGAMIALACPEIIMAPEARMGSAVIVSGTGDEAVDAKYASNTWAIVRAASEAAGRPGCIAMSMMQLEAQLFAIRTGDSWSLVSDQPRPDTQFVCLDNSTEILNLTGAEAAEYGVVQGICSSFDNLLGSLDCDDCVVDTKTGLVELKKHVRQLEDDRRKRRLFENRINEERENRIQATQEHIGRLINTVEKSLPVIRAERVEALINDPNNSTYFIDPLTGRLTPESLRRWRANTDLALARWNNVIALAKKAADAVTELETHYEFELPEHRAAIDEYYSEAQSASLTLRERRDSGP